MPRTRATFLGAVIAAAVGAGAFAASTAVAQAPALTCAGTTDASAPAAPSAGHPCWTDVTPYPFGADGNPVDPTTAACAFNAPGPPGPSYQGDDLSCYLQVTSMAFRAWNRGLAATSAATGTRAVAFGVWLFNGTRWFPDPTFPGSSVCPGNTVLWAGKLDYWLVGRTAGSSWPRLCRFDGVSLQWEPLAVPQAALASLPTDPNTGQPLNGGITSGSCAAWNNCWFLGDYGVMLHWDGQELRDASLDVASSPWLKGDFSAATTAWDASGNPLAFAVTDTGPSGTGSKGQQLPPQPDGSPPPQLYRSDGGPFSPLAFSPPTAAQPGDPYRTDLVGLGFDPQSGGWVAGDPVGWRPPLDNVFVDASSRRSVTRQPAPLSRFAADGTARPCQGYDVGTFYFDPNGTTANALSYLWSTLALFPGTGAALAGAQVQDWTNSGTKEPALVAAACGLKPVVTRFRMPDPTVANQATAAPVPVDANGFTDAVAVNAVNDAWAATTTGSMKANSVHLRPHLYRLTDGQPPLAPSGDDYEPRPSVFTLEPPVYVQPPPTYAAPPAVTQVQTLPSSIVIKKQTPAIYAVKTKLRRARNGTFILYVTFKVRRKVTIGVQGLRKRKLVTSSGFKTFSGPSGQLSLKLDRRRWPTKIRFVTRQ